MKSTFTSQYAITGLLLIAGCIDPYSPSISEDSNNILVVDGYLNSSDGTAQIKLKRAISLYDNTYPNESNASVIINSSGGTTYPLAETSEGYYELSGIDFSQALSEKYQLQIQTQDGKEYQSDFVELKKSPPIDSITWKPSPTGITLYANSHDSTGKSRYYQWTYKETWEYNADHYSSYKLVDGVILPKPPEESFYICWNNKNSSKIIIGSTIRLSQDIVKDFPLTFIERGSKKISRRYHILVQQRTLTEEAFNYWQQLQKTTESLGGLFDPLPSQVISNVHNIKDPFDPVLGYFNGGSVQTKAIFIRFYDLPDYLLYNPPKCSQDSIKTSDIYRYGNNTAITSSYGTPFILGYLTTANSCIDCRSEGGTTTKPDFWP